MATVGVRLVITRKIIKLLQLSRDPQWIAAIIRNGVAAAVEHIDAIDMFHVATLIDIGANKGQFSLCFHTLQPDARIIAFEPLASEADRFERTFIGKPLVELRRVALSDHEGEATFHVTNRADSSSLLPPGEGQSAAFGVNRKEELTVPVRRLDSELDLDMLSKPVLIKMDVQGAELDVLNGIETLDAITYIYVELSFVELYEGQPAFSTVMNYLIERGFEPAGFFNQVTTRRFGPTQVDVMFIRK